MAIPRPIDIKILPADEGWLNELFPNRSKTNLSSKAIGIEIPNDNDSIIIDFDWKTIRGKQILIRKGNPGALNGNDMRKINIAVDAAHADFGNRTQIRDKFVKSFVPENKKGTWEESVVVGGADNWAGSPSGHFASNMVVGDNVMKGRDRHAGLSPNQLKTVKAFESEGDFFPPNDMKKSISVMRMFNRRMAEKEFGKGPYTFYRGIYGDQAKAIKAKAKTGDTVRFSSNSLASFTSSVNIAKGFRDTGSRGSSGVIIKTKIMPKSIFDSWASNVMLGGRPPKGDEQEIIVSPRGLKITGVIM